MEQLRFSTHSHSKPQKWNPIEDVTHIPRRIPFASNGTTASHSPRFERRGSCHIYTAWPGCLGSSISDRKRMGSMGKRLNAVDNDRTQSVMLVRIWTVEEVGPRSTDTIQSLQMWDPRSRATSWHLHIPPLRMTRLLESTRGIVSWCTFEFLLRIELAVRGGQQQTSQWRCSSLAMVMI